MKPLTQVIVTLLIVWGSILVYDRVRDREPEPTASAPPAETNEAPEAAQPDEPEPEVEPAPEPDAIDEPELDAEPTDEEIDRFLVLLEAAEQTRRERRTHDQINRQLERTGIELTDEQRSVVISMTMTYRDRVRMLWRELPRGNDEESRAARREVFDELRSDFAETLEMVLTPEQAKLAAEGLAGTNGFGGRGR